MLSPHELATLMLVKNAIDTVELDPADFNALLERELATRERVSPGHHRALITINGHVFLKARQRDGRGGH
ncbi:hypothetical protein CS8_093900 [Cupriavidus sp. 8B]